MVVDVDLYVVVDLVADVVVFLDAEHEHDSDYDDVYDHAQVQVHVHVDHL